MSFFPDWRAVVLAVAVTCPNVVAGAETVVSGKSAQALRCAAYIGMAGQYGYVGGVLTASDMTMMTRWSAQVLEMWVPLAPQRRLDAYRTVLGELGSQVSAYELIDRHADWCVAEFTPRRS
jgi:hypothetical protein